MTVRLMLIIYLLSGKILKFNNTIIMAQICRNNGECADTIEVKALTQTTRETNDLPRIHKTTDSHDKHAS